MVSTDAGYRWVDFTGITPCRRDLGHDGNTSSGDVYGRRTQQGIEMVEPTKFKVTKP